jgi:hypothetical protein
MATPADVQRLECLSAELRLRTVLMMGHDCFHHFGGSLSAADGVSFLENQPGYHNYFLTAEQHARAVAELRAQLEQVGGEVDR